MLETQIKRFENKEPRLKQFEMNNLITSLKKELPWLCEVSIHSLQNIHKDLKLSDRIFICPDCGFVIDRDYNAAINLMNYSNSL